jgi:ferredoxin
MSVTERPRTPSNVPGPFYVAKDECITCGAPEAEAPSLIRHDDEHGSCYFYRQPDSADDTHRAIRALAVCCVGAVRYAGKDPDILRRAADVGSANQCDHPVRTRQAPPRTHVTFRLDALDVETVARSLASAVAPSDDGAGRWVAIVDLDVGTIDDALRSLAGVSDLRWYTTEEYRGRRRQWTKYPI